MRAPRVLFQRRVFHLEEQTLNGGLEGSDPVLPPSQRGEVRRTLEDSAGRVMRLVESFPAQPLPQEVAEPISAVLDSLDQLLKPLCGEAEGVRRHPSCRVTQAAGICAVPLRLQLREASILCSTFEAEEERLNMLVEDIKRAAPDVDFRRWGPALAETMGTIYVEILRPLRHQHPELDPSVEDRG
jgi:hypothetical protein